MSRVRVVDWTTEMSTSTLPRSIGNYFADTGGKLHDNLSKFMYKAIFVPEPTIHNRWNRAMKILEVNPRWYSDLYRQHSNFRRDRSLESLERIAMGKDLDLVVGRTCCVENAYVYDTRYRNLIFTMLTQGYYADVNQEPLYVPMVPEIRRAFGLPVMNKEQEWLEQWEQYRKDCA